MKAAIAQAFAGSTWQRCTVHFMRNILAQVSHKDKKQVAEAVKLIFEQPNQASAASARSFLEHLAQEGMNKLLNPQLEEPSEQHFDLFDELVELEALNTIYAT